MEFIVPITKLDGMFEFLKSKNKKRMVVAYANDSHTIDAVGKANFASISTALMIPTGTGQQACVQYLCPAS